MLSGYRLVYTNKTARTRGSQCNNLPASRGHQFKSALLLFQSKGIKVWLRYSFFSWKTARSGHTVKNTQTEFQKSDKTWT